MTTSYTTTPKLEGQKIGIRGVAYFIDILVSVVLDLIAQYVFSSMGLMLIIIYMFPNIDMGQGFYFERTGIFGSLWGVIVRLSLHVLYFTLFEAMFGRTIGKLILGLKVVQYNGAKCSGSQATIRGVYRILDGLFFGLVAYLNMKPPFYQRIGDRKAKTIVVDAKEIGVQPERIGWSFFAMFGIYFLASGIFQLFASLILLRFA